MYVSGLQHHPTGLDHDLLDVDPHPDSDHHDDLPHDRDHLRVIIRPIGNTRFHACAEYSFTEISLIFV